MPIEGKRNAWCVMLDFGIDPVTGKRNRPSRIVHGTKTEARKVRDLMIREHESGLETNGGKTTFAAFIPTWKEQLLTQGSANEETIRGYETLLNHVAGIIGRVPLEKIDAAVISETTGAIKKKGLSGTTLRKVFATTKRVFAYAVALDLILRNPCDRLIAPKANESNRRSLSADDCRRLLQAVEDEEGKGFEEFTKKELRRDDRGVKKKRASIRGLYEASFLEAISRF